jgi:hypothetical protein
MTEQPDTNSQNEMRKRIIFKLIEIKSVGSEPVLCGVSGQHRVREPGPDARL